MSAETGSGSSNDARGALSEPTNPTRRPAQLTLGFIEGITEVEIVNFGSTTASDNCFERVRGYETQRSSQRAVWRLQGWNI